MASQEPFAPTQVTAACTHSIRAILAGRYSIQLTLEALQAPSPESVSSVLALFEAANAFFDKPFRYEEESQAFCASLKPTCLGHFATFCLQLYRQYAEPQMPQPTVLAFSELYKGGAPLQCCNNFDKDFLRARFGYTENEGLLQLFPYLYAKDWEVTPGRSQDGKGDLVLTDGIGSYLVLQMQYIDDRTGHTARVQRTAKRKKVLDQAVRYTEKFVELHPEAIVVLGAAYTNERGVQWLGDQQKGCQAVVQALLMTAAQKPRPLDSLYSPDLLPSLQMAMAARRLASFDMPQPGSPGLPGLVDQSVNPFNLDLMQAVAQLQMQNAVAAAEQAEFEAVERGDSTSADAAVYLAHLASGGSFTQPLFISAHRGDHSMPNMGSFTSLRDSFTSVNSHALNDPLLHAPDAGDGYDTPARQTDSPGSGSTPSSMTNSWLAAATQDLLAQHAGMELEGSVPLGATQDQLSLQMLPQQFGILQRPAGLANDTQNSIWNPFQSQCFSLKALTGVPEADDSALGQPGSPTLRSASHTGAVGPEKPLTPRVSLRAASVSVLRHPGTASAAAAAVAAAATAAISEPDGTSSPHDLEPAEGSKTPEVQQEPSQTVDTPPMHPPISAETLAETLAELGLAQRALTFPAPGAAPPGPFDGLDPALRQALLDRHGGASEGHEHPDFPSRVHSTTPNSSRPPPGSPLRSAVHWDAMLAAGFSPKQVSVLSKPRSSSVPRASHLGGHHSPIPGSPRPNTPPAAMLPSLPSIATGMHAGGSPLAYPGQPPLPGSKLSFISSNAQWGDVVAHLRGQCQGMSRLYKRWADEVDVRQSEEEQIQNFFRLWAQQMAVRQPTKVGPMLATCQGVLERAVQLEREIMHMHDAWLGQVERRKKLQADVAELYRQWNQESFNQQRMSGSLMSPHL